MSRLKRKAKRLMKSLAKRGVKLGKKAARKSECYALRKACERYRARCPIKR